jgi:hypothetical protein
VAIVGIGVVGASGLKAATVTQAAPLAIAAQKFPFPFSNEVLSVGAITAMLGVLLNLILLKVYRFDQLEHYLSCIFNGLRRLRKDHGIYSVASLRES